jgi:hypothetical protein
MHRHPISPVIVTGEKLIKYYLSNLFLDKKLEYLDVDIRNK